MKCGGTTLTEFDIYIMRTSSLTIFPLHQAKWIRRRPAMQIISCVGYQPHTRHVS